MPVVKDWDSAKSQAEHLHPQIYKSETDKREYRTIRLPNGLEALLISCEHLTTSSSQENKAACSLCLDVGEFSNPPEILNITYFLTMEYMYFQKPEIRSEVVKHDA
ncbi:PREDICTED: insulin-degrading enzyme homolog [Acromyrmex echinatior]|uniref:insulin-degrading enzyme homolog n=1 Tax=Acromyrmex echinatior TaxID=103372 RepID=UPI000580BA19|nr:PREDICTED: insulin-degrading enzyme homolog [Acromyrmex echinatior]